MWEPWLSRPDFFELAKKEGIKPPRLYEMGFAHANCGGFCVKGGHSAFAHLLKHFPDRYEYHSKKEEEMRQYLDKNIEVWRQVNSNDDGRIQATKNPEDESIGP